MKRSIVAAVGLSLFLVAGNAHAVLFQFYTTSPLASSDHVCPDVEGAPSGCPGSDVDSLAYGNNDGVLSFTNGTINVSAVETTDGSHLYADYNPTEGGLGALLTGFEEDPDTNPDNLVNGQSLLFTFDQEVTMLSAVHFDEDHLINFDGNPDYMLIVDGGAPIIVTIAADGMQDFGAGFVGTTFEFTALGEGEGGEGFYVSAFDVRPVIPEPGTAMLLGIGFIGLGAARRRAA